MNDGGVDRQGRFFCGSMPYDQGSPRAAFYRYDADGGIHLIFAGVTISNGVAWSADGERMYYIDTPTQRVDAFDYDPAAGMPSARRDHDQHCPLRPGAGRHHHHAAARSIAQWRSRPEGPAAPENTVGLTSTGEVADHRGELLRR